MMKTMAQVNLNDLEVAMQIVGNGSAGAKAWVARDTGCVHIQSDEYMTDGTPLPVDIENEDRYLPVPGMRSLDLGSVLAFRFTEKHLPGDEAKVREFFRKPGAYARFSRLLETQGARDQWHRFRDAAIRAALIDWCEENELQSD
jgi:hypothetical protein